MSLKESPVGVDVIQHWIAWFCGNDEHWAWSDGCLWRCRKFCIWRYSRTIELPVAAVEALSRLLKSLYLSECPNGRMCPERRMVVLHQLILCGFFWLDESGKSTRPRCVVFIPTPPQMLLMYHLPRLNNPSSLNTEGYHFVTIENEVTAIRMAIHSIMSLNE